MTSDDAKPGMTRSISRGAFEIIVFATVILLFIAESIAILQLIRAFGFRNPGGGWIGLLTGFNIIFARVGWDAILKRFGRSLSGKTFEVRERILATPEGEVEDGETAEIRLRSSTYKALGTTCLLPCVVIALILLFTPRELNQEIGSAYALIAFFAIGAGACFYQDRWGKPQAWADLSGIWAMPVGLGFRGMFVPWTDVSTCEIATYFNTFGEPAILRPTLKGADGRVLLVPDLTGVRVEDRERLVKFIKARLPKTQVDLWEL